MRSWCEIFQQWAWNVYRKKSKKRKRKFIAGVFSTIHKEFDVYNIVLILIGRLMEKLKLDVVMAFRDII